MLHSTRVLTAWLLAAISLHTVSPLRAEETAEQLRLTTAVALNYCRASFHRIQRTPSKRVLIEEQEKILNNLNLRGVADQEVVNLYAAVLQEIGDVQIIDTERHVIRQTFRRAAIRDLALNSWALGTQLASQQYLAAAQTGAKSWWDYRSAVFARELDLWRIDRERMQAVINKSSLFLDTFWKLARKRNIPDHWLVRHHDLDELDKAVREAKPEVRLRLLSRMEKFMETFPPYWYYVGRTQQVLGRFDEAAETYRKLAEFGSGHFRRDEMLAAAMCNLAVIEEHAKQPTAVEAALEALEHDTDVWEVNIQCGLLLARNGRHRRAEDAILRNLDMGLETTQSRSALALVYLYAKDCEKLSRLLSSADVVRGMPAPLLLSSAAALGTGRIPPTVTAELTRSLTVDIERRIGKDDIVLTAGGHWQFNQARVDLNHDRGEQRRSLANASGYLERERPTLAATEDGHEIRFRRTNVDGPLMTLFVRYPHGGPVRLYLQELSTETVASILGTKSNSFLQLPLWEGKSWRLTAIDLNGSRVLLPTADASLLPTLPTSRPRPITNIGNAGHTVGYPPSADDVGLPVVRPH